MARPAHLSTHMSGRVVVLKLGGGEAIGLMPRVASGVNAEGAGEGDSDRAAMIMNKQCVNDRRIGSVVRRSALMLISIRWQR